MRNKTAHVPLLDSNDVADLYLSRGFIENAVVRILAERRAVPRAAVDALARFRTVIASGDKIAELVESDIEFHRALVAESQSPRLRRLYESVIGQARYLCMAQVQVRHLLHPQVIADEHMRILAVIEAGNAEQAVIEMQLLSTSLELATGSSVIFSNRMLRLPMSTRSLRIAKLHPLFRAPTSSRHVEWPLQSISMTGQEDRRCRQRVVLRPSTIKQSAFRPDSR